MAVSDKGVQLQHVSIPVDGNTVSGLRYRPIPRY
jgi:hypothetical protein